MARDPHILARKFVDRWMVNALGVGLFDRPVWRRETEDLRRLLRATTLPKRRVAQMGSVVRRKSAAASSVPPEVRGSSQGGSTPPGSSSGRFGSGSDRGSEPRFVMPAGEWEGGWKGLMQVAFRACLLACLHAVACL